MSDVHAPSLAFLTSKVDDDFARYFRQLGFDVTWDFSQRTGERWYEIYDGDRLLCQAIPIGGVPVDDFLEDITCFVAGRTNGTSKSDWSCRCDDNNKLKLILDRVAAAKVS